MSPGPKSPPSHDSLLLQYSILESLREVTPVNTLVCAGLGVIKTGQSTHNQCKVSFWLWPEEWCLVLQMHQLLLQ